MFVLMVFILDLKGEHRLLNENAHPDSKPRPPRLFRRIIVLLKLVLTAFCDVRSVHLDFPSLSLPSVLALYGPDCSVVGGEESESRALCL